MNNKNMSKYAEGVRRWRDITKQRMVDSMGGKCQCCGYNKCNDALDFHHINPNTKIFEFGKVKANPISWIRIVEELRKCILVCANCHKEIHANQRQLPFEYQKFNEDYLDYKKFEQYKEYSLIQEMMKTKSRKEIAEDLDISEATISRRIEKFIVI